MSKNIDHVGVVVKDVDEAASLYHKMLGLEPWGMGVKEDKENGVRLLSLPIGDTFIELIQPTSSENRFARFLKERGGGLFHLCIFVEDFDNEINNFRPPDIGLKIGY